MHCGEALRICCKEGKCVRHNGMPVGDWVGYCAGAIMVPTDQLWDAHVKDEATRNYGQLEVTSYYFRYSHATRSLTMMQLESIDGTYETWEVLP